MTRNIAETVQRTKKTLNHDHPLNPRQGAYRAAHGQRPMRGAATGGCLCTFMSRSSGWRFLRGADSTHARRSVVIGDVLVPGLFC